MIIQNITQLLSHGNIPSRHTVLDIFDVGLQATDPYENTKKMIRVHDGQLIVGHEAFLQPPGRVPLVFDLSDVRTIYVVSGGKVMQQQAKAMEDVLVNRTTVSHINAKRGEPHWCTRIVVVSMDSDGTDGPSVAAGGLVDGSAMRRLRGAGVDMVGALQNHNFFHALKALGDSFFTGARGTNVRDLHVIYIHDK